MCSHGRVELSAVQSRCSSVECRTVMVEYIQAQYCEGSVQQTAVE
jgi:hypothetical protein